MIFAPFGLLRVHAMLWYRCVLFTAPTYLCTGRTAHIVLVLPRSLQTDVSVLDVILGTLHVCNSSSSDGSSDYSSGQGTGGSDDQEGDEDDGDEEEEEEEEDSSEDSSESSGSEVFVKVEQAVLLGNCGML